MNKTKKCVQHAVKKGKQGERNLWVVAAMINAARCGKNGNERWAQELARELAVSTDTIYWRGFAYYVYLSLRNQPVYSEQFTWTNALLQIRRELTLKHFVLLGRLWKQYEFSPKDAIEYLVIAAEEKISARSMHVMVENIHANEDTLEADDEWVDHFNYAYSKLSLWINDYSLPEPIIAATKELLDVLRDHGIGDNN